MALLTSGPFDGCALGGHHQDEWVSMARQGHAHHATTRQDVLKQNGGRREVAWKCVTLEST